VVIVLWSFVCLTIEMGAHCYDVIMLVWCAAMINKCMHEKNMIMFSVHSVKLLLVLLYSAGDIPLK